MTIIQTSAGPVKICTLWDFLPDVKRRLLDPKVREVHIKNLKEESHRRFMAEPNGIDFVSESILTLEQNPMTVLNGLTSQLYYISFDDSNDSFRDVLEKSILESFKNNGSPTHVFPIDHNKFILANCNDFTLYTSNHFNQVLQCEYPRRNLLINVPYLTKWDL